jgi:hypothetical protein
MWSKTQIRQARKIELAPLLNRLGFRLRPLLSAALSSAKPVSLTQIDIVAGPKMTIDVFPLFCHLVASSAPSELRSDRGNCVSSYNVNDGNFSDVN